MIATIFLLIIIAALSIPAAAITIPWFLITGNFMPLWRSALFIVRTGLRIAGIRLQIEGIENIPTGRACIFMANHVSNLDPPLLTAVIHRRTSIFYKNSLNKIPILGYAMRLADFVPVTRDGNLDHARESARRAKLVLDKDISITTFIEGKRSIDGRLLPFKKGPFYLARESGAPCLPVSISGTESMMRKGSMRVLPGVARVVFHPPIDPAAFADRDALSQAVRASIQSGLPDRMR